MAIATSTAIALALAAASAGAGIYNQNRMASQQDRQAAAGIRQQQENQRQANERLNQTLRFQQEAKPEQTRAVIDDQFMRQVQAKLGQAQAGVRQGSGAAYEDASREAAGKIAQTAATDAGLLARIDSPVVQRQQEGFRYGDLGMDLDILRGNVQGDQFLNNLRMRGIRRNPYIDAAAGIAGGAAQGMMAGAGTAANAPAYGTIAPVAYQNNLPWALPRYAGGG
jgi:hypothetical protein